MANEIVIAAYRNYLKQLLPLKGNRYLIISKLDSFKKRLLPYIENLNSDSNIEASELYILMAEIELFVRKNFPASIVSSFLNLPKPVPQLTSADGNLAEIMTGPLMGYLKGWDKWSLKKASDLVFVYDMLYGIYNCIKDNGLHPEIENRDTNEYARYNVIIEHRIDSKNSKLECMPLISLGKLRKDFIAPFHLGQPMLINGMKIREKKINRLTITVTLFTDDEIILFKERNKLRNIETFIRACREETNSLLDKYQPDRILENPKKAEPLLEKSPQSASDGFIDFFIKGIAELQRQDDSQDFIVSLKTANRKDEGAFRNWFRTYFSGVSFQLPEAEALKGDGRIDLKIFDKKGNPKIIEFKGWWNKDVFEITKQVVGYLTDFEDAGYILMINHLKIKDITAEYKQMITARGTYYIEGSWQEITYLNSSFIYFCSRHQYGNREKVIFHFIYRLYP